MNSLHDLREAEQAAWANGDVKTSELLKCAISLVEDAENERDDLITEQDAALSESDDQVIKLKEFLSELIETIKEEL